MKKYLFFLISICFLLPAFSQIPIGSFREHLPYRYFYSVADAPDCVYAATENSIMIFDKNSRELETWSKVEGLSEIGISRIHYSKDFSTLIIAYTNSNIDLIRNGKLTNFPDIKNKQIMGSKEIRNIYEKDGIAYLSCAFGVVLLDLKTFLVKDTWFTKSGSTTYQVNDCTIFRDSVYIATEKGVFYMDRNGLNIGNFAKWQKIDRFEDFYYNLIFTFNDKLYVNRSGEINSALETDTLFIFKNNQWTKEHSFRHDFTRSVDMSQDMLAVGYWNRIVFYDADDNPVDPDGYGICNGQQFVLDKDRNLWVADLGCGLRYINHVTGASDFHQLGGPRISTVYGMDFSDGILAIVPGSNEGWVPGYLEAHLSYFSEESWKVIDQFHFPILCPPEPRFRYHDLCAVAINPRNTGEFYAGSWGNGVVRYLNSTPVDTFNGFNTSHLQGWGNPGDVYISGLCYDNNNNLWMANSRSTRPLVVLQSNGTWKSLSLGDYSSSNLLVVDKILVDSRNYKWITMPRDNRLIVYNDNNTISNTSDDQIRSINLNAAANIATSSINCIAEDKEGLIWLGTDKGIKVVYTPSKVFTSTVAAQNILIELGGYYQNLLEFETITTIAVDGANRKWIGTAKAGIFLVSANGTEELLHFTEDNSPLFSNQINDIAIHPQTGEVFIGTAKGLISYRGTATEGKEDFDEALVFPNPVRENYTGTIAVSGLMENSFCKIADSAGNLVWQGYAHGGQFTWDGRNFSGNKVATGVYFVFASDQTGKEKKVSKILIIK